jgi:hypothetical protein
MRVKFEGIHASHCAKLCNIAWTPRSLIWMERSGKAAQTVRVWGAPLSSSRARYIVPSCCSATTQTDEDANIKRGMLLAFKKAFSGAVHSECYDTQRLARHATLGAFGARREAFGVGRVPAHRILH